MALGTEHQSGPGVAELVADMADGFGKLVTQHVTLAKLEFVEDTRVLGTDLGLIAAFAPFLFMAYALLCFASVVALQPHLGFGLSFLAVAAVNAVIGGVGVGGAVRRIRGRRLFGQSLDQFKTSSSILRTGGRIS